MIYGNFDTWRHFPESYDELWVLGDLVNYGPEPAETIDDIGAKAAIIIQGNHDYAVAHDDDSRWSEKYRKLSTITRKYSSSAISQEQKVFLQNLPGQVQVERNDTIFHLTHATISDNHYGKWPRDDSAARAQIDILPAEIILCGHSHVPFIRTLGGKTLVNPGSIGQPRSGKSEASYAVWEDGKLELKSYNYPVEATIGKIMALGYPEEIGCELASILKTGKV